LQYLALKCTTWSISLSQVAKEKEEK